MICCNKSMCLERVANIGYAAQGTDGKLEPWRYTVREPLADEVLIKVMYCGICHSDIHMARNEWGVTRYPVVPGHEFVGRIEAVGSRVSTFKVGDKAGVGFMVDSCDKCEHCKSGRQMHCAQQVETYSGFTRGEPTYGGYGRFVVCRERFAIKLPEGMDLSACAPLFCAGITTWSPIANNNMARGHLRIGVIGLGGLGHMAVQFASKVNPTNEVYVISRSKAKEDLAQKLGAVRMIQITNADDMREFKDYFHYLIDTVAVSNKPLDKYCSLLKHTGSLIAVGLPPVDEVVAMPVTALVSKNCSIQGSLVGGLEQTKEMVDFAFKHKILPMVEHVRMDQVNEAIQRVLRSDVLFRFVLDVEESMPVPTECEESAAPN